MEGGLIIVQIIKSIITSVLTALYQPFWYAVLSAILLCFLYLYAYHSINTGRGLKVAVKPWIEEFKTSVFLRKLFLLISFTVDSFQNTFESKYVG